MKRRKKRGKKRRKKKKRLRRVVLIGVGVLILCVAGFAIYTQAKNVGFTEGKSAGYAGGYDNGYLLGHESGYENGHAIGYQCGYENGYECGYDNGYEEGYENGGYTIKDPTYLEMLSFIEWDNTDNNEYVENVYTCQNFAADVCNHAEEENIRCAYINISFPEGGHAIVAFNTVNRGLIFIEPQSDEEMEVRIGKPYWSRDKYLPPAYDDTVVDILIVW